AIVARESEARGLNIETVLGNAESMPFEDATFEGVTCRVAPHHFANPQHFVNESFRVLAPGGWFLLVDTIGIDDDPGADDALNSFEALRDPSHVRDYTVAQWISWVESAGFEVQFTYRASFRHELEDWMDRMSVLEPARTILRNTVNFSTGALMDYFQPENGTFLLHQVTLLAVK
ncbi:MAG TPA: class I SAM-dependent methyltransferase, partial [Fimbriimonadaceae bacterium]|nr:class I SAM-dependent methyltransferase [Fimbriimonadaceae bacterium]